VELSPQGVAHGRARAGLVAVVGMLAWGAVMAGALLETSAPKAVAQDAASDPAAPVFASVCGKCHPKERVIAMRRTRSQWEEVITTMITARAAQISDDDFDTVLGYLARQYGRVNVNRAPASDIVEVLHVEDSVAASIVTYRKEQGAFADFDALTKVPGVDREKLEALRDAILF
jgi:competence ComEA-like helix-hairpin-helix protein